MAIRRIEPPDPPEPIGPPLPTNYGAVGWLVFWLVVLYFAALAAKSVIGW